MVSTDLLTAEDLDGMGAASKRVEVVSSHDRDVDLRRRVGLYQSAGVPLIWLTRLHRQSVTVHALGQEPRTRHESDTLDGDDVLPGFRLPVSDIFA